MKKVLVPYEVYYGTCSWVNTKIVLIHDEDNLTLNLLRRDELEIMPNVKMIGVHPYNGSENEKPLILYSVEYEGKKLFLSISTKNNESFPSYHERILSSVVNFLKNTKNEDQNLEQLLKNVFLDSESLKNLVWVEEFNH